jgi:hypothetical protein
MTCGLVYAQKPPSLDDVATVTATAVLRTAFRSGRQLPVETAVLADKGRTRVMRAVTATQTCIVKLERDGPDSVLGWAVREQVCWER